MRTKILTIQIFILFLASALLFAQSNNAVKEKLQEIKGDVSKIVISSENGDVVFDGDEAKQLFKKMKSKRIHKNIEWISNDGHDFELDSENIMIIKHDSDKDIKIIDGSKKTQIEVEEENGEKKVTVTTNEDGDKNIETFNGKEADEYLDKMEDEHDIMVDVKLTSDDDHVWIYKNSDEHRIEKEIQ